MNRLHTHTFVGGMVELAFNTVPRCPGGMIIIESESRWRHVGRISGLFVAN